MKLTIDKQFVLWCYTGRDMEQQIPQPQITPAANVGFPNQAPRKKSKLPLIIVAVIGVLLILGVGGWFVMQSSSEGDLEASPTPASFNSGSTLQTPQPTSTPAATATATPKAVDKSKVTIEIQNGTGTPGDAGYVKTELEKLGYKEIETGNATDQGVTTTTVTFDKALSETVVTELTTKLEALFTEVTTKKSTVTGSTQVKIVTGTKKAKTTTATKSPSATATAKASATPTATPKATGVTQ